MVPYLGLYLTDLTFIEEGGKDVVVERGRSVINFAKCQMVGKALTEIIHFQKIKYALEPSAQVLARAIPDLRRARVGRHERHRPGVAAADGDFDVPALDLPGHERELG